MKIRTTWKDILLTAVTAAILIGSFIYIGVMWKTLPDEIPAHFNMQGDVIGYEDKRVLWTMPCIALLVFITIQVVKFFPQTWSVGVTVRKENLPIVMHLAKELIEVTALIITVFFCYLGISIIHGSAGTMTAVFIFMAVLAIPIVVYLIRASRLK